MINLMYVVDDLKIGGPTIFVTALTNLDQTKYNISVCCLFGGGELVPEIEKAGIKVFVLGLKQWKPWLIFKLAWVMRRFNIQIVHTHLFASNLIGRIAALISRTPVIIAAMRSTTQRMTRLQLLTDHFLSHITDRIMVIDEPVKQSVIRDEKIDPRKIVCIHNAIDQTFFNLKQTDNSKEKVELNIDKSNFIVGTVASLSPIKGHIYIIRAVPIVLKELPNTKFIFVGNGPSRKNLEQEVQKLNIAKHVIFIGYRRNTPAWISLFDIFVHPCLIKGIPKAVIEAMAMKKAVVANTFSIIPNVIEDQITALLAKPKDPKSLAQAIIKLLKDKNLKNKIALEGYERVKDYFHYPRMINELESLYDKLIQKKKPLGIIKY